MQTSIKTVMTGAPKTIEPAAAALAALDLMIDHAIRHLPVVDVGGRPVGVLSFDDLRAAFPVPLSRTSPPAAADRQDLRDISVGEVMTYAPMTLTSESPLREAAEQMAGARIGCLIIVDSEGRVEGILSETDLLHALATTLWTQEGRSRDEEKPRETALLDALHAERLHVAEQVDEYQKREQQIAVERHETPLDLAEHGADVEEARTSEGLAALAARRLRALDHALERAARGELTHCERCSGEIPEARLRALPGATFCVRCARATESPIH